MEKKKINKVKENPIMVDQKRTKNIKVVSGSEDTNEVKAFIIIIIIIAILIGVIYGFTELFKKEDVDTNSGVVSGEVNYDKVSVGTILNRPYDNYYVMVYDANDDKAVIYSTILTNYMQNSEEENYIKIYFCDLSNTLNKEFYNKNDDGKSNPKAKKTEDFDFGNITLLKVEKGKITKYLEDFDTIKEMLK